MKLVVIAALAVALAASVAAGLFGVWPELGGTGAMPPKKPASEAADWLKETKGLLGWKTVPEGVRIATRNKVLVQDEKNAMRERIYADKTQKHSLTPKEEAQALLNVAYGVDPNRLPEETWRELQANIDSGNPVFMHKFINDVTRDLYDRTLDEVNSYRGKAKMRRALKRWTENHGGAAAP